MKNHILFVILSNGIQTLTMFIKLQFRKFQINYKLKKIIKQVKYINMCTYKLCLPY